MRSNSFGSSTFFLSFVHVCLARRAGAHPRDDPSGLSRVLATTFVSNLN
jgi:hypothetical protein